MGRVTLRASLRKSFLKVARKLLERYLRRQEILITNWFLEARRIRLQKQHSLESPNHHRRRCLDPPKLGRCKEVAICRGSDSCQAKIHRLNPVFLLYYQRCVELVRMFLILLVLMLLMVVGNCVGRDEVPYCWFPNRPEVRNFGPRPSQLVLDDVQ